MSTTLLLLACLYSATSAEPNDADAAISFINDAERRNLSAIASIFSPRMDFDQWKPLTGRGDPLRNDPTYDYEPPLLDRVHYWADDTRLERDHFPERKSEVLMLGVSSRRPSIGSRQQPMMPRRHQRPPPMPPKYEDYTYKLSEPFPMTILVPPPPPPHSPSHYVSTKDTILIPNSQSKPTTPTLLPAEDTFVTNIPEQVTTSYALQEANLIYQSSSTNIDNWILDLNKTKHNANSVSSDYAGWGPTTPIDVSVIVNETQNFISHNDHLKNNAHPYSFYKPMLSEALPPPPIITSPLLPTFVPTAPPTVATTQPVFISTTQPEWTAEATTTETIRDVQDYEDTTTETQTTYHFEPTPKFTPSKINPEKSILDMLGPMMTMPLVNGPERPEDNLYAHASNNVQVFKEQAIEDITKIETMQTMQPPPIVKLSESTTVSQTYPHMSSSLKKPSTMTHDPYLHMRFTTPMPTVNLSENIKSTTEAPAIPMYLIIQGHSKVKTYSSKPTFNDDDDTTSNEIPKQYETNEVKHLHPIKEQNKQKKGEKPNNRTSKSHSNLRTLVDNGLGSIEIQETDIGIKYDVSDGSNVPVEIYRKGIVETDENAYTSSNKKAQGKRNKRQIGLEDFIPFDEDTIEEYVYNYLKGKRNETGITGLIAQAITSNAAAAVDELEDDEEDDEER